MERPYPVACLVGPTAVGKSALALQLAQATGAHIVSADARQVYAGIGIGTGQPTAAERATVPHHLVGHISLTEHYHVGRWLEEILPLLAQLHLQRIPALVVGGTGLYTHALEHGLDDIPSVSADVRQGVSDSFDQHGLAPLVEELRIADPATYAQIDLNNPQRVRRALEVYRATGLPISSFRRGMPAARPFKLFTVGLERPREELYHRINARVEAMMAQGLLAELEQLLEAGAPPEAPGLQTLGYAELMQHRLGRLSLAEAVALIQQNTRHYAKRQLTWWRKRALTWLSADDGPGLAHYLATQGWPPYQ